MRYLLLILCLCLAKALCSQTQLSCLNANSSDLVSYSTGHTYMYHVFCGDLNNDGRKDIISSGNSNTINVLLATSGGTFAIAGTYTASGGAGIITGADYNKDGNLDIAVSYTPIGVVDVLFGNGNGGFGPAQPYYPPYSAYSIRSADINNDTNIDLVMSLASGSVSVMYGTATGSFVGTSNVVVGNPTSLFTDDLNNDGKKDVVSVNPYSNTISVLLAQASGTLSAPVNYTVGTYPTCVAINDLNNDGIKDLAVSNRDSHDITVLLGTASGSFSTAATYSMGGINLSLWSIVSADFNSDTYQDLVACDYSTGNVYVLNGNGTGSFNSAPTVYALSMNFMSMEYLNNDAIPDLVFITNSSGNVTMFYGNGRNLNYPYCIVTGIDANDMISGDFDRDSKLDLALATSSHSLAILKGLGNGLFAAPVTYPVGINPTSLISEDLNGDSYPDIAVANYSDNSITILLGSSSGTFSTAGTFSVGATGLSGVAAADVNSDNIPDLAVANASSSNIRYLLGNGNGTFSLSPNITWWAGLTPASIVAKDLNNDGRKDFIISGNNSGFADIAILYNNGNVTFASGSMNNSGNYTTSVIAEDLNLDGNMDYASAGGNLNILKAGGTWDTYSLAVRRLKAADIDHDGFPDVVGCMPSKNKVGIVFEKPGTNNPSQVWAGNNPVAFATGDFNNDGMEDIVTSNSGNSAITVLLNGLPKLAVIGPDSICKGNSAALSATGASTYSWSSGATGVSASVSPTLSTTYTLTGTSPLGCSNTTNKLIKVINSVLPVVTVNSGTICAGDNFTITPSGASTYSYTGGSNVVSPSATTSYTVTGAMANGCNGTTVSSVTVNSLPLIVVNTGSICAGETFTLNPSGANSYTFSSGSPTVNPVSNTTYTVSGTDLNGCVGLTVTSLTVTPLPVITANSGTICAGGTFTIVPSGAATYTCSSGTNTVTPAVTTSYTVTGTDANGCVNATGVTNTVTVNAAPSLTATTHVAVCVGTSTVLNVAGANTYSWTNGATTTSISVSPTITTSYSVTGTGLNNCSTTETIAVTVNPTCQDVWPGDANSDGVADNFDVLELGLHFSQSGAPRATTSNSWQSYFSGNWTGTISNGKNVNHSDCNGDGTIDNNDTLAIFNNYGSTHAFRPAEPTLLNPQLSIVPDQAAVAKGNWGTSSIFLGEASLPVNNINGLAFTVSFDQSLIEANSFYIEYPTSFINANDRNLKFSKTEFSNGRLYTATTHTITNNVNGNGKIAILHYKIKASLATDEVLNIGISQAKQSSAAGALTPLTAGAATVAAIGASVGIDKLSGNTTGLYPNPANASATIQSSSLLQKVEVLSIAGQLVFSESASGTQHPLDLKALTNGVYFVNVYNTDGNVTRKKLVVQH